jgi:hypothetical protein
MIKAGDQVAEVLRDLTFPAEKWRILTQAELYGAGVDLRAELHDLPPGMYTSAAEIAAALDAGRSGVAQQL